jgi:hypothetical protein
MTTFIFFGYSLLLQPFLGYMIARWITRRWAIKGFLPWGWIAGLGSIGWVLLAGQIYLAQQHYNSFRRIGPCTICYEWSGFSNLFIYFGWVVAFLVFLISAAVLLRHNNLPPRQRLFPKSAWYWLCVVFLVAAIFLTYPSVILRIQLQMLVSRLPQATEVITGNQLKIIGVFHLKRTPGQRLVGMTSYITEGGLLFSPDGRWLAMIVVNRSEPNAVVELRQMPELKCVLSHPISISAPVNMAFNSSSDSFALGNYGYAAMYRLNDSQASLAFETNFQSAYDQKWAFSQDGSDLRIIDNRSVMRIDIHNGSMIARMEFPEVMKSFAISPEGNLAARRAPNLIQIIQLNDLTVLKNYLRRYFIAVPREPDSEPGFPTRCQSAGGGNRG